MEVMRYIEESLLLTRERTLGVLKDLTDGEIRWRPGPEANHIAFILWHMGRIEDNNVQWRLQGKPSLWESEGWHKKYNLSPKDTGFGFTTEQVTNFPAIPLKDLLTYFSSVHKKTLDYLKTLTPEKLDECPSRERPDWSIARFFYHMVGHENHHQGQIDFIRGLRKSVKK